MFHAQPSMRESIEVRPRGSNLKLYTRHSRQRAQALFTLAWPWKYRSWSSTWKTTMHGAQTRIFHQKSLRFTEVKSHVLKAEEGGNIFNVVRAYFPLLYRESLPVFLPQRSMLSELLHGLICCETDRTWVVYLKLFGVFSSFLSLLSIFVKHTIPLKTKEMI